MSDVVCPKCNAKGNVATKVARSDKGKDVQYYECATCQTLWTNSTEVNKTPSAA